MPQQRPRFRLVVAFTLFHVALSLVGIVAGFVVAFDMLGSKASGRWTAVFLSTTAATSVTGFMFPFHHLMPSHIVGLISLAVLSATIFARYPARLAGRWRGVYAGGAVLSQYLNVFVLIAQAFAKIPFLRTPEPNQPNLSFILVQSVVLVAFAALGISAVICFRPASKAPDAAF
jgi:hypothetical protein